MFRSACALLIATCLFSAPTFAQEVFAEVSCRDLLKRADVDYAITKVSHFHDSIHDQIKNDWPELSDAEIKDVRESVQIAGTSEYDTSFSHCLDASSLNLRFQRTDGNVFEIPLRVLALYEKAPLEKTYLSENPKPQLKKHNNASFSLFMEFPTNGNSQDGEPKNAVKMRAGWALDPEDKEGAHYRFINVDDTDLKKGLVVILCVNDCSTTISQLLTEFEDSKKAPSSQEPDTPDDKPTSAPPEEGGHTRADVKDIRQEPKVSAFPSARHINDLVELKFHLDGELLPDVAIRKTCEIRSLHTQPDEQRVRDLSQAYIQLCIESADARYEFDKPIQRDGNSDTLVIDIALKRVPPKQLRELYIPWGKLKLDREGWDLLNCSLMVQFETLSKGNPMSGDAFKNEPKTIRQDGNKQRFVLIEKDAGGVLLENLALQITAADNEGNTCRLKEPFRARVSEAVEQRLAEQDQDGNLTFDNIGLLPRNPDMHVFLLSYTRPESLSNEGSKAVYGFDELATFKEYAVVFLNTLTDLSEGETPPNQLILHAPTETGVLQEIARKTWAEIQGQNKWAMEVLETVQMADVDYADSNVTNALTTLRNAGQLDDGAKIRIFGRSGFYEIDDHCRNKALLAEAPSDTEIIEVTKHGSFPNLDEKYPDDRVLNDAKLRTYSCDGTGKHHLIFTDTKTFDATTVDLQTVFDAIKAAARKGENTE